MRTDENSIVFLICVAYVIFSSPHSNTISVNRVPVDDNIKDCHFIMRLSGQNV